MKKILIFFILIFLPHLGICQSSDLPRYYIVNKDTLGMILSMQQMKRIKNDLELKKALELTKHSWDSTFVRCLIVIDDNAKMIKSLELRISQMDSSDREKTVLLDNCLKRLSNDDRNVFLCDSQRKNDSLMISNLGRQINTLKLEKTFGWFGTGGFLLTTIILAIVIAIH